MLITATMIAAVKVGNSGIEAVGLGFGLNTIGEAVVVGDGVAVGWLVAVEVGVGMGFWGLVFVNVIVLPSVVAIIVLYV